MQKHRIIVGASGQGRSLKNLLAVEKEHHYQVAGVFSNKPNCGAVEIAREHNLPIFTSAFANDQELRESGFKNWIAERQPEWIVLAGFLKKMPMIESFNNRCINIHPSLLPKYGGPGMYGMRVHRAVIENKEQETGASIHFVTELYDDGKILSQVKVQIDPEDTPEKVAENVFKKECQLLPKTIDLLALGDLDTSKVFELKEN